MRGDLPAGTVTFLFTDVEGSTRLLDDLGSEDYAAALAEHRRIVREVSAREGGVEVDTQGDAFFVAFPTAPGAIAAARAVVDGLGSGPVRVRIGVHTGTPLLTDEGYVGPDVHRAARIAASGHGDQVLVSSATRALLDGDSLRDLGEHRFKDLAAAERVYQLGDREFPPLRSLYRTNLPVPATPFLGRERELGDVVELLVRDDVRLLTMTGPGGTGKTRLALQAAAEASGEFPDGIWWVGLAPLRDARLLVTSLAQVLMVEERADSDLAELVVAQLASKRALVLVDNVEHLLPEVATEIARLRDAASPTILVTSRERLQLQGEHVYPVPTLADDDGIELFLVRARALASRRRALGRDRRALQSPRQPSTCARAGGGAHGRISARAAPRDGSRSGSTCSRPVATRIHASRRSERRSNGRTTCSSRPSRGCFAGSPSSPADAPTTRLSSSAGQIPTRFRRSWTRACFAAARTTRPRYWMLETIRELACGAARLGGRGRSRSAEARGALPRRLRAPRTSTRRRQARSGTTSSSPSATTCARHSRGRSMPASVNSGSSSSSRSRTGG